MSIFTTSDYTSEPGKDFDANVRYEREDHYGEMQQGYHHETILHQMEDDDPLDYRRQIDRIGYIEQYIINMRDTMFMEDAGKCIGILQAARERLEAEKNERFNKEKV